MSQICNTLSGPSAIYWDNANGIPVPLTQAPLLANPGLQFIQSQYPALGFQMPQGYNGVEIFSLQLATIRVNVLRNDNAVVWRHMPATLFQM